MENNESRYTDRYRLDADWLMAQWERPDGEERMTAFYESIHEAIVTDDECWENKGRDVYLALAENDTALLMVALCGWGPKSLAKRAMIMRGRAQYQKEEIPGTLVVDWSDDNQTDVPCMIRCEDHMVCGFDYNVFTRSKGATAKIEKISVQFKAFENGYTHYFQCVSQAERDAADDSEIFWYPQKEE